MSSLADALGLESKPTESQKPSAKRLSAKKLAEVILDSDEYLASVKRRIVADTLPAAVETLLYHYRYGKPADKLDFRDKTNELAGMTTEQLEARAMTLMHAAQKLRGSLTTESH